MVRAVFAVVFTVLALGACAAVQRQAPPDEPRPAPAHVSLYSYPWTWTNEEGQSVRFERWRGEPMVVTAMFTSCRSTCPRTIGKLQELYAAFSKQGRTPQFVLVTLDPANDTPETLRQYKAAAGLPASWQLLTGSVPQTQELTDALDIHIVDMGAHLLHDGRIVVFDAQGMPERTFSGWGLDRESPTR